MNKYKLRAECLNDSQKLFDKLLPMLISFHVQKGSNLPDVEIEFETTLELDEITLSLEDIPDSHVMLRTIEQIKFSGKTPIDDLYNYIILGYKNHMDTGISTRLSNTIIGLYQCEGNKWGYRPVQTILFLEELTKWHFIRHQRVGEKTWNEFVKVREDFINGKLKMQPPKIK